MKAENWTSRSDCRVVKLDVEELDVLDVFAPDTAAVPALPGTETGARKFVETLPSTSSAADRTRSKTISASADVAMVASGLVASEHANVTTTQAGKMKVAGRRTRSLLVHVGIPSASAIGTGIFRVPRGVRARRQVCVPFLNDTLKYSNVEVKFESDICPRASRGDDGRRSSDRDPLIEVGSMGLYLRSRDLEAIAAVTSVLTAPLAFATVRQWVSSATERFRDLIGGEGALVYGPGFGLPGVMGLHIDPKVAQDFGAFLAAGDGGELRSKDSNWNAGLVQRRSACIDVWTMADVRAAMPSGVRLEDTVIYQEVTEPSRLLHACGIGAMTDAGEAHLGIVDTHDHWRFGEDTRAVARLVQPAFTAGCIALARLLVPNEHGSSQEAAGASRSALFDRGGQNAIDVSPEFAAFCAVGAARDSVAAVVRSVARAVAEARRRPSGIGRSQTIVRRLRVGGSVVEVLGTWLADGDLAGGGAILVHVHDRTSVLPSRAAAVARGLTSRETDVALLLAQGLSRAEVASALSLSAHTVRHHTEAVFRKLGVHTRGAVALALLRDD